MKSHNYSVYITTNRTKTVLYTGVTNNLCKRLYEHWCNRGNPDSFAGKYWCYELIFYEDFRQIKWAIEREKEIKGWRRKKKMELILSVNQSWRILNKEVCGEWPPKDEVDE